MNARRLILLLLAALALIAAGCGGDDSNEAGSDTDAAVVETNGEETTDDDGTETSGASTDDDLDLSGECAEFAGLGARISQAVTGGDQGVEEASGLFDELASRVPDEIKDDFAVIAESFSEIAEALKDVDLQAGETPSPEDLAKLQELTQSLNSAEVAQAGENIEAWAEANC